MSTYPYVFYLTLDTKVCVTHYCVLSCLALCERILVFAFPPPDFRPLRSSDIRCCCRKGAKDSHLRLRLAGWIAAVAGELYYNRADAWFRPTNVVSLSWAWPSLAFARVVVGLEEQRSAPECSLHDRFLAIATYYEQSYTPSTQDNLAPPW